jgi:MFS transporter, FHS family, glucose/mannose:H+ symporter
MSNFRIKLSLFLNYFVFAILLNSVGTVILMVQKSYGISKSHASVLEPFKDLSIAIVSFLITSFITRIGYKKAMLIALGFVSLVCFIMPLTHGFLMTELLFASAGSCFALIKISVFASIGLVTRDEKEHLSFMNFLESFFGVGVLAGYFIFPLFINKDNPGSTEWLNVYYLLGGISLAAFFLLLSSTLDESAAKAEISDNLLQDFTKMFTLFVKPIVLVFIVSVFLYVLLEQSIMSWLPTFNNDVLKINEVLSIQMASILAGSIALGRFLAGILLRKMKWVILLISCLAIAAAIVLISMPVIKNFITAYHGSGITSLKDVPIVAYAFPLIGLVLAPIYPAINSVVLTSLPKPQHGLMSGLIIVFSALGGTTGSLITGSIFQYYGGQSAFYLSLVPVTGLIFTLLIFSGLHNKQATATSFENMKAH